MPTILSISITFKEIGADTYALPIVERIFQHSDGRYLASVEEGATETAIDFPVTPRTMGKLLCTIFDEWVRNDVGEYFIQLFDATLANWVGEQTWSCSLAKTKPCPRTEFNGDVYACDHFVFPQYKLGNIYSKSLVEMMYSEKQLQFGRDKCETADTMQGMSSISLHATENVPKNRFCKTASGETGLNYLCKGYYQYFDHVAPYMDFMKKNYWLSVHLPISWKLSEKAHYNQGRKTYHS